MADGESGGERAVAVDAAGRRAAPRAVGAAGERRIAATLRAHRIRRLTAERPRRDPPPTDLTVAAGVTDAVARVRDVDAPAAAGGRPARQTEQQIDPLLEPLADRPAEGNRDRHRDAEILHSLPGVGRVVTATMLIDASAPLMERDYSTLRA